MAKLDIYFREMTGEPLIGVRAVIISGSDPSTGTILFNDTVETDVLTVEYDPAIPVIRAIVGKEGFIESFTESGRLHSGGAARQFRLTRIDPKWNMDRWTLRPSSSLLGPKPMGLVRAGYPDNYMIDVNEGMDGTPYEAGSWEGQKVWFLQGKQHRWAHIEGTSWLSPFLKDEEVTGPLDTTQPPPGTLREQWDDFFNNPDVIKAITLLPSSVQESFSLVFSNYSIINDREQEPELGDQVSVALILAGLTTAAVTALWTLLPLGGATTSLSYIEPGLTAAKVGSVSIPGLLTMFRASALRNPLLALLLLTQIDLIFWGPSVIRDPIKNLSNNATGYKITLENAIKNKEWTVARTAFANLEVVYREMDEQLSSVPMGFFEAIGVNYDDFRVILKNGKASLDAYTTQHPQLVTLPVAFPKEFILKNVTVEDGDTLVWPDHPEVNNRIRIIGIDSHEEETTAGKEEAAYLKSLIENRDVTIKTHEYGDPERTIGRYGRLLGGVFLGDTDIALAMLEHFGKSLLVETKYQKKYRWIDWDEYKKVATAAVGPSVKEFKIYIDSEPTRAKLYIDDRYTHHLTPSNQKELKDVMEMLEPGEHVIKAEKSGKAASVKVNITDGANPDIMLTLKTVGLEPEEPAAPVEPSEEPEEPPVEAFELKILSTPLRAKVYIDGTYTHHLTPSDEEELEDVMNLLTPGKHVIRATKAGKMAEKEVEIVAGYNEPVYLSLTVVGLPPSQNELINKIAQLELELEALRAQLIPS